MHRHSTGQRMSHEKVGGQLARAQILPENGRLSPAMPLLREAG